MQPVARYKTGLLIHVGTIMALIVVGYIALMIIQDYGESVPQTAWKQMLEGGGTASLAMYVFEIPFVVGLVMMLGRKEPKVHKWAKIALVAKLVQVAAQTLSAFAPLAVRTAGAAVTELGILLIVFLLIYAAAGVAVLTAVLMSVGYASVRLGVRVNKCPRCVGSLDRASVVGAYREPGSPVEARCETCRIHIVDAQELSREAGVGFFGSSLTAEARRTEDICPRCEEGLCRLTLRFDKHRIEVEECARCGLMVLDDGEFGKIQALVEDAGGVPIGGLPKKDWLGLLRTS